MHIFSTASVFALAAVAAAQNTVVQVGGEASTSGGVFQYLPASITASNGSVVTFRFSGAPGNHTVTQSSFSSPCEPLSGGFDSGWIFVPQGTSSGFAEWNLTITDDAKPIWFYCKQLAPAPHCKAGMVGAINAPTSGNTFSAFQSAAMSSSGNPGQGEGGLVGQGASASAPAGPFSGGVTGFSIPTGTAPPPSAAASTAVSATSAAPSASASASASSGAATHFTTNGPAMLLAAVLGVSLFSLA